MNTEIIKDENKWLLEAINEQYEAIHHYGEKIPQIEFDILMENVRKFYENMRILQRLNDPVLYPEKKIKTRDNIQNKADSTSESHGIKKSPPPVPVQFVKSPAPSVPASVRHETTPVSKKTSRHQEIDLFASEETAFSGKLKEARERSLGPKIMPEQIENLKAAININEKFMFINELFDGNLREYNETIETLNGFKTFDQAADFLHLMRKKNFWNTGSTAFKKLKELIERRF